MSQSLTIAAAQYPLDAYAAKREDWVGEAAA
jgi:hypothetical protein